MNTNNELIKEQYCYNCEKSKPIECFVYYGDLMKVCKECKLEYQHSVFHNKKLGLPPIELKYPPKQVINEKHCPICEKVKLIDNFKYKRKNGFYIGEKCISCHREKRNKEKREKRKIASEQRKLKQKEEESKITEKCCKICNQIKPKNDFIQKLKINNSYKFICSPVCSVCYKNRKRDTAIRTYAKNKEKVKKNAREARIRNPEKCLLSSAKCRAKKMNFDFNLELSDIIIPEFCPVLGIKLEYNRYKCFGSPQDSSPSLDRVDSSKGYIKGNVKVISWKANMIKSNGTSDEHRKIADYMDKNIVDK